MIFHLFDVLKVPRNRSQGLDNPCDDNRGTSHAVIKQKLFCRKGITVAPLDLKGKSLNINISSSWGVDWISRVTFAVEQYCLHLNCKKLLTYFNIPLIPIIPPLLKCLYHCPKIMKQNEIFWSLMSKYWQPLSWACSQNCSLAAENYHVVLIKLTFN